MLAAEDLDVLWVVGANPLERARARAPRQAFVVVQDLFLTETAARADVVFPAACAYEKSGTVTNTCGEVQRLKQAVQYMGAKPDLEIIGLLAKEMGAAAGVGPMAAGHGFRADPEDRAGLRCAAAACWPPAAPPRSAGYPPSPRRPRASVRSAHDTLFTSGTLGRYSKMLSSV